MSNVDPTRLVTNLIAAERLTTPSVRSIEPEVRSGGIFPFCDLLKHGEGKGEIEQLLKDSVPPWYARDRMGLGRSIQPAR